MEETQLPPKLEDIFTAPYCAVLYLKKINFSGKIYLIGTKDFLSEIVDGGFTVCAPIGPDPAPNDWLKWAVEEMTPNPEVKAVVVGFDEHIGFVKCLKAATYLKDPDCLFLATNTDETYPCPNKSIVVPGTGTMVAAVTTASQRKPIVVGKPEPFMTDCIRFRCPDLDPARTVMIGDRLNTDIQMGRRAGMKTILVGSGVHGLDDVRRHVREGKLDDLPDFYVPTLGDIVDMLA
ncbi:4-nitrophenylphosphatase, putative [Ixodes scapularis]|uniref:4-nitrophenylphosphatase, putative n=2 Tax=Ixodes scapularis TaxID=6945 RepID=B7PE35_IXOSC|nr:4-nitrophenylphosphatase, putative [Ixodes scapularis]|eukprot:XP_002399902.1 4-nitrophenylphosphatase, putative [Ixodes scapularis]